MSWPCSGSSCAPAAGSGSTDNPDVEVKLLKRKRVHYLLARSQPRRQKERAIRRRQRRGLARALAKLQKRIDERSPEEPRQDPRECRSAEGPLPQGPPVRDDHRGEDQSGGVELELGSEEIPCGLGRATVPTCCGAIKTAGRPTEFWETYIQLTVVEHAFRVLKSELRLRPVWHHYSGRTQAHVMICVLAYALWKTLDHLAKRAGLETQIHKPDPHPSQGLAEASTDDARGHPPGTAPDRHRRHRAGDDRRPETGPSPRRSSEG